MVKIKFFERFKPKIKQRLKLSGFMKIINIASLEKFWQKDRKHINVIGSPIFINTLSRGYFSIFRRYILKRFIENNGLEAIYITELDQIFNSDVAKKSDIIFIASGDGFFDGVMGNYFFNDKSLGFFPLGVGNAVFSFFYRHKRYSSLIKKCKFFESEIDIISLEYNGTKSETLGASIGLDAEFMKLHPPRTKIGVLDYIKGGILTMVLAESSYPLEVIVDNKTLSIKHAVNITLGKLPFYGFKVRCLPYYVKPDNGLIYILICKSLFKTPLNKLIRGISFLSIFLGMYNPVLKKTHCENCSIISKKQFPIQSGGEFLGYVNRVDVTVKRKQKFLTT
jgi:diacylglycerol kinase family enzyme